MSLPTVRNGRTTRRRLEERTGANQNFFEVRGVRPLCAVRVLRGGGFPHYPSYRPVIAGCLDVVRVLGPHVALLPLGVPFGR